MVQAVRSILCPPIHLHHHILTQAICKQRLNCPLGDSPAGISKWLYPDLYSFCTSSTVDCDCYPSSTNPAGAPSGISHLKVDQYQVICRRPTFMSSGNLQTIEAVNMCRETCMCYGGPVENWSRHPHGPDFVGPVLPLAVVQAAWRAAAEKQPTTA